MTMCGVETEESFEDTVRHKGQDCASITALCIGCSMGGVKYLWKRFYPSKAGIIFLVDCCTTDRDFIDTTRNYMEKFLDDVQSWGELPPLLVACNTIETNLRR